VPQPRRGTRPRHGIDLQPSSRHISLVAAASFAACLTAFVLFADCSESAPAFSEQHADLSGINGIWISRDEIQKLPTRGPAWDAMIAAASRSTSTPNLSDQEDMTNVRVLAKALAFVRTGQVRYRDEVIAACTAAIGTEKGGRTLSLGRELAAYVIAADLVKLPESEDAKFRA
jgi:hypothetical protein